jgi:hypothetical protein
MSSLSSSVASSSRSTPTGEPALKTNIPTPEGRDDSFKAASSTHRSSSTASSYKGKGRAIQAGNVAASAVEYDQEKEEDEGADTDEGESGEETDDEEP